MDKQDIDRERRKQRRLEQMGTNEPVCLTCECTTWYNFHGHHVAGKRYDKEAIEYFCVLCHGDRTEEQRYHPSAPCGQGNPTPTECAMHFGCGLTDIVSAINNYLSQDPLFLADRRATLIYLRALAAFLKRTSLRLRYHVTAVANENAKAKALKPQGRKHSTSRTAARH